MGGGDDRAVGGREAAAGEGGFEEVARAGAGLAHRPAIVETGQCLDAVDVQAAAQDDALFAQCEAYQRPLALATEAAQQRGVLLFAVFDASPVQGADVGTTAGEQFQPGECAGGAVGDEGLGAECGRQRRHGGGEQRVVAAGDEQAIGQGAAVGLLQQPFLQQRARKQPLAADARGRDVLAVGELVELLLVQVEEGSGFADGEAGAGRGFGVRYGRCRSLDVARTHAGLSLLRPAGRAPLRRVRRGC